MSNCAAFWHHTNIRNDNNVFPCCRFKTPIQKFDGDVVNILNSAEYKALREHEGPIAGCAKCDYEETMGKKSLRQKFNEEYDRETVKLEFLEVGLDNICNLTCDGCWDEFSSSWAKKLNSTVIVRSSNDITVLPDTINKVLFLGGEPLMSSRHVKLLKIANRANLDVTYNTNGSFLLDETTIALLNECKHVKFILSIDGYNSLNEQVRGGSKWEDTLKFIEQIKQLEFELVIHTVVHLNNWHGLPELEKFVKSVGVEWTTNILTYPTRLDIVNMKNKKLFIDTIKDIDIPNKDYIMNHITAIDYQIDATRYNGFEKLKELAAICNAELATVDWDQLTNDIQSTEKDTSISWAYGTGNSNMLFESVDSTTHATVSPPTGDIGSWLFLILEPVNNDHSNFKINNVLQNALPKTISAVQNLPGIFHAHLNRVTPHFRVPEHEDAPKGKYVRSIIVTLNISKTCPELVTITIDGKEYNFKDREYFAFESFRPHYADNLSDSDWIALSVQIRREFFE